MKCRKPYEDRPPDWGEETSLLVLPPLADSYQLLRKLSVKERANWRLIELLVLKDPGAIGVLTLGGHLLPHNLAPRPGGLPLSTILKTVGGEKVTELLLSLWDEGSARLRPNIDCATVKSFTHKCFLVMTTAQNIVYYGKLGGNVKSHEVQQMVLFLILALTQVFVDDNSGDDVEDVISLVSNVVSPIWRSPETLTFVESAISLANCWEASDVVIQHLESLALWHREQTIPTCEVQVLLLADFLVNTRPGESVHEELFDSMVESFPLLMKLVNNRVDLVSLLAKV